MILFFITAKLAYRRALWFPVTPAPVPRTVA